MNKKTYLDLDTGRVAPQQSRRPEPAANVTSNSRRPSRIKAMAALAVLAALGVGAWKLGGASGGDMAGGSSDLSGYPKELRPVVEYLRPSQAEARVWFDSVASSAYVREKWGKLASATQFEYLPNEDTMNAYAYFEGGDSSRPAIRLLGGWVRMSRLVGALALVQASAVEQGTEKDIQRYLRRVAETAAKTGGLSESQVIDLLNEFEVGTSVFQDVASVSNAKAFAEGICKATLAHEIGHIAGGHSLGADPNATISQNEERQADLFAASVAASVANGQQMLIGQILTWYTLALGEEIDSKAEIFRSHPYSADRLRAAVESNKALAASIGITTDDIAQLVAQTALSSKPAGDSAKAAIE